MAHKKYNFQALPIELTQVSSSGTVLIPTETSVSFSAPCTGDELETFFNNYVTHQVVIIGLNLMEILLLLVLLLLIYNGILSQLKFLGNNKVVIYSYV